MYLNTQHTKKEGEKKMDNRIQNEFSAKFYDEINNVIGGTNPNEKLTLLLPGIALTKSDFEYNYKDNEAKGPVIEANESRLANKLYDPADLVGGDNGKTLEHQYKSALDMLTPKVNPILANAKNQLRELLMKPYPYKFGPKNIKKAEIWDGLELKVPEKVEEKQPKDTQTYTFQEVFFRLYDNYVEQLSEWANQRQIRKEYYQIKSDDKGFTDVAQKNKWVENQYLQWYEDNGETWLTAVNQKMSVLLSIFSDNDMKIIEGILDSGSGAELQEARQTLKNTRKINPDGGYIYPVKFNPTNWFDYLDTSFTSVDLINSPTAILNELNLLYNRRDYINIKILDIAASIPSDKEIENLQANVDKAKEEFIKCDSALQAAVESGFTDFAKFAAKTICAVYCPSATAAKAVGGTINPGEVIKSIKKTNKNLNDLIKDIPINEVTNAVQQLDSSNIDPDKPKTIEQVFQKDTTGKDNPINNLLTDLDIGSNITKGIDILTESSNRVNLTQYKYLECIEQCSQSMLKLTEKQAYKHFHDQITNLNIEKQTVENKIKILEKKLSQIDAKDINKCFSETTNPPAIPEGFSQFVINHTSRQTSETTSQVSTSSYNSSTSGFWIFKKQTHSSQSSSSIDNFFEKQDIQIEIGMNIAKVGIERKWFNPGIFALTDEMYSVAGDPTLKICRREENSTNSSNNVTGVFPCYPTAMVIARDVSIRLTFSKSTSSSTAREASQELSNSKTFFVYNAGESSSSHTSYADSKSKSGDKVITMRFTTPQIIGFYQQIVPEDKSAPYPNDGAVNDENSIVKFIEAYEKVIDARLPKTEEKFNKSSDEQAS